jgi:hypothetical protein
MSDEPRGTDTPTDEERARAVREQFKTLHAFDLAYEMMISLVSFGYQKMGLTDETRELRDLGDARLAIELLRANLEVVEREQGEERTRDVRSTLAQMQLGYAQAVHLAGAAPAARPQADTPAAHEPSAHEPAASAAAAEPAATGAGGAPKKPTPRKPAAKKPAAKKPATDKAAPKKPAAKKPAPKKPRGGATPPAG